MVPSLAHGCIDRGIEAALFVVLAPALVALAYRRVLSRHA